MMPEPASILYCHCACARVAPEEVSQQVLNALRGSGAAFEGVADLCELAARGDPMLKRIARSREVRIAACYPRAVKWLFAAADAPLPAQGVEILNMRTQPAEEIIRSLLGRGARVAEGRHRQVAGEQDEPAGRGEWLPWFPVIDYDRCKGCKQCMDFCLFGVYAVEEDGSVRVENPANCKPNCPACARICPEAAIMFPKYHASPINGDEVRPDELQRQKVKVDVKELLAGDVYEILRNRSKGEQARAAKELDQQRALGERAKCSCASQPEETVVPLEALLSSPSLNHVPEEAEEPKIQPRQEKPAPGEQADLGGEEDNGGS